MTAPIPDTATRPVPPGVLYARIAGYLLGVVLLSLGSYTLLQSDGAGGFSLFKGIFFLIYGMVHLIPFQKLQPSAWKFAYGILVLTSIAFVFIMIAAVMFAYMEAAERGERLGVPGFEGTLIFLALMQIPAVVFHRNPDLID